MYQCQKQPVSTPDIHCSNNLMHLVQIISFSYILKVYISLKFCLWYIYISYIFDIYIYISYIYIYIIYMYIYIYIYIYIWYIFAYQNGKQPKSVFKGLPEQFGSTTQRSPLPMLLAFQLYHANVNLFSSYANWENQFIGSVFSFCRIWTTKISFTVFLVLET